MVELKTLEEWVVQEAKVLLLLVEEQAAGVLDCLQQMLGKRDHSSCPVAKPRRASQAYQIG
jgi:hypothetical protein